MSRIDVTGRKPKTVPTEPQRTFNLVSLTQLRVQDSPSGRELRARFDLTDGQVISHEQPLTVYVPDIDNTNPRLQAAWDQLVNELSHYYTFTHIQQEIAEKVQLGEDIKALTTELNAKITRIESAVP